MKIKSIAVALLGIVCLASACNRDDYPLELVQPPPDGVCVNVYADNPCPTDPDSAAIVPH